jgi:hypothetical protein
LFFLLLLSLFHLQGSGLAQERNVPAPVSADREQLRTIVFMTDFGLRDDAVGICRGVMDGIASGVRIMDITHEVTPFDIAQGARFLSGSSP